MDPESNPAATKSLGVYHQLPGKKSGLRKKEEPWLEDTSAVPGRFVRGCSEQAKAFLAA